MTNHLDAADWLAFAKYMRRKVRNSKSPSVRYDARRAAIVAYMMAAAEGRAAIMSLLKMSYDGVEQVEVWQRTFKSTQRVNLNR